MRFWRSRDQSQGYSKVIYVWVMYCGGRRHPRWRLDVEVSSSYYLFYVVNHGFVLMTDQVKHNTFISDIVMYGLYFRAAEPSVCSLLPLTWRNWEESMKSEKWISLTSLRSIAIFSCAPQNVHAPLAPRSVRPRLSGTVLAQKFWGHCPVSPFVTEFCLFVLRNRKIRTPYRPTFEIYRMCNIFKILKNFQLAFESGGRGNKWIWGHVPHSPNVVPPLLIVTKLLVTETPFSPNVGYTLWVEKEILYSHLR